MEKLAAIKQEMRREVANLSNDMQTTADEIRLKLHLAGAEGRDIWNQLEPQLMQFKHRLEQASDSALADLRSAGKDLKSSLERLCQELHER